MMQQERSSNTRQNSSLRVSHRYLALITMTHGHPWQNLNQFGFCLPQPHSIDGLSVCLIFTVPFSMENFNKEVFMEQLRNQTGNGIFVSYLNPCMDSNRQAKSGTILFAEHLQIFHLGNLKLIQPFFMLTRMAISPYSPVTLMIVQ